MSECESVGTGVWVPACAVSGVVSGSLRNCDSSCSHTADMQDWDAIARVKTLGCHLRIALRRTRGGRPWAWPAKWCRDTSARCSMVDAVTVYAPTPCAHRHVLTSSSLGGQAHGVPSTACLVTRRKDVCTPDPKMRDPHPLGHSLVLAALCRCARLLEGRSPLLREEGTWKTKPRCAHVGAYP